MIMLPALNLAFCRSGSSKGSNTFPLQARSAPHGAGEHPTKRTSQHPQTRAETGGPLKHGPCLRHVLDEHRKALGDANLQLPRIVVPRLTGALGRYFPKELAFAFACHFRRRLWVKCAADVRSPDFIVNASHVLSWPRWLAPSPLPGLEKLKIFNPPFAGLLADPEQTSSTL